MRPIFFSSPIGFWRRWQPCLRRTATALPIVNSQSSSTPIALWNWCEKMVELSWDFLDTQVSTSTYPNIRIWTIQLCVQLYHPWCLLRRDEWGGQRGVGICWDGWQRGHDGGEQQGWRGGSKGCLTRSPTFKTNFVNKRCQQFTSFLSLSEQMVDKLVMGDRVEVRVVQALLFDHSKIFLAKIWFLQSVHDLRAFLA